MTDSAVSLYDRDFYAWASEQAAMLRAGRLPAADIENIAEEIESICGREKGEMRRRLQTLLLTLLRRQHLPERRNDTGRGDVLRQRRELAHCVADSPSLRPWLAGIVEDSYQSAVLQAEVDDGLPATALPAACPWTFDQITAADFWPGDERH